MGVPNDEGMRCQPPPGEVGGAKPWSHFHWTPLNWPRGGQKPNNSNQGRQCVMPTARRPDTTDLKEFLISRFTGQSAERKKMAAVHFTTIPFEPNLANYTLSNFFLMGRGGGQIRPGNSNIAYPRFEVYKTFLCVFMSNFMVFMR